MAPVLAAVDRGMSDPGMRSSWLPLLLLLPACATHAPRIVATATDATVELAAVAADLAMADVVALGELHETPPVHRTHHELLAALHARRPNLVIAMEMFERDGQTILLKYLNGFVDEATFRAESRLWPHYDRDYRPVIEFAKQHGLVVLAANAPRKLASQVAREGFAAVAGNAHVARESTAPEDDYWESFQSMMKEHPGVTEKMMKTFYAAQCAKDDTMAETITDYLRERGVDGDKPLCVLICGRAHSDHGWGTVARIKSRMPGVDVRVLSAETVADMDAGVYTAPKRIADYVVVAPEVVREPPKVGPVLGSVEKSAKPAATSDSGAAAKPVAPEPAKPAKPAEPVVDNENLRPALGLMPDYNGSGEGVLVSDVRDGGAASQAGIESGDVLVALNGTKITDVQHYSDLLDEQTIGKTVTVRIRRDGAEVDLQVKIGSRPRTR